jgi:hypothetical protein
MFSRLASSSKNTARAALVRLSKNLPAWHEETDDQPADRAH